MAFINRKIEPDRTDGVDVTMVDVTMVDDGHVRHICIVYIVY